MAEPQVPHDSIRRGPGPDAAASPLDRFIPAPDVRERFETTIQAPADLVMRTAAGFDMQSIPSVRLIFRLRDWLMRAPPTPERHSPGLLAEMEALGWGRLDDGGEGPIVCGAMCRPWQADPGFEPIPKERFATDATPDRVKIAWTLEAYPLEAAVTRFVQETRVVATEPEARAKFRKYWRWARFGVVTIRLLLLRGIRRAAEREWAR